MDAQELLNQLQGIDKGKLRLLIYALIDVDNLTYGKVSVSTVTNNLDRCPHLAQLLNVPVTAGQQTMSGVPVPDTGRAKILLEGYNGSFNSAMARVRRQQAAKAGNYQIVRF